MKKYFKHFAVLFIITAVLLVAYIALSVALGKGKTGYVRGNNACPAERVYDYADLLTDTEEDKLRALIAEKEAEIGCDIVLLVINEPGVTETAAMNYADDFYDQNNYGYNMVHGDGALFLDNCATDGYTWFSTCGRVESEYSSAEIESLLDEVYEYIYTDPYKAYATYVNSLSRTMSGKAQQLPFGMILAAAAIITIVYVIVGIINNKGKKTTTANTYVVGGNPVFHDMRDIFVTKHVTKRRIESSSGGGGGGHHRSSGGVSHGGGGRGR